MLLQVDNKQVKGGAQAHVLHTESAQEEDAVCCEFTCTTAKDGNDGKLYYWYGPGTDCSTIQDDGGDCTGNQEVEKEKCSAEHMLLQVDNKQVKGGAQAHVLHTESAQDENAVCCEFTCT